MSTQPLNVLIVGASIAGPTAAYWFAKAGAKVTVIERYSSLRKAGQNIDIRTVGVTVMRKIPGMEAAVRSRINLIEGFKFEGDDRKPFATMRATEDAEQQSLVSEYEILRGDLSEIMYDMTKENEKIKYIFGEQIASMQKSCDGDEDGPVTVEFANGTPAATYDLIVACDGSTSRTRAMGFNCAVRDHIHPINSWAAYFSISQDLLKGSRWGHAWSTVGGRWLAVGPDRVDPGVNRVTIMGIQPRSAPADVTLPFREAAKQGQEALKQYILQRFGGVGWMTDDILAGMMESKDIYASEIVQVKVPRLYNGRVVLVGDAGYAPGPTGTGTSLALAGAYILAGEISTHPNNTPAGLKAYEERMRPLVTDMQKIPPGVPGMLAPQTRWGIRVRNLLFRIVTGAMALSWLFGWVGRIGGLWTSAFGRDEYGLPDYQWVA